MSTATVRHIDARTAEIRQGERVSERVNRIKERKNPIPSLDFLLSDIPFPVLASQQRHDDDNEGDEASDNCEWTLFEGRKSWSSLGGKRLIVGDGSLLASLLARTLPLTHSLTHRLLPFPLSCLYLSILCPLGPSLHSLSSSVYLQYTILNLGKLISLSSPSPLLLLIVQSPPSSHLVIILLLPLFSPSLSSRSTSIPPLPLFRLPALCLDDDDIDGGCCYNRTNERTNQLGA